MDTLSFLDTVVSTQEGYFCLFVGDGVSVKHQEHWYTWPNDREQIVKKAQQVAAETNVYFATGLFQEQKSTKDSMLPSHTISVDLDEADVTSLPIEPTILVETSEGRHQGFWVLSDDVALSDLEQLSQRLTYSIEDADRNCWALARKTRLPGTLNWKYVPPQLVSVIGSSQKLYVSRELDNNLLSPNDLEPITKTSEEESEWLKEVSNLKLQVGPLQLLAKYKGKLPSKVSQLYRVGPPDPKGQRSEKLWGLMASLFRAGATAEEVYWIAKHSTWNKWAANRYNADRDLGKDVWRAKRKTGKEGNTGPAAIIAIARKQSAGSKFERHSFIATLIRDHMTRSGEFMRSMDGQLWYLRADTGRPIIVSNRSDYLVSLIEQNYGLNPSEEVQRFVINNIVSWTREHGKIINQSTLSYHSAAQNQVMLHTGQKDVYVISPDNVYKSVNGQNGVLFTWSNGQPFDVDLENKIEDWANFVFQDCFNNLVGLNRDDAINLLRVWLLFVLMRESAVNRPILTFIGQPGSGKSTIFRMVYSLLYGPHKSLDSVTSQDNFDYATITEPLVVLDNVDTWAAWLPDRLAQAAATSDITKRKLYSDSDTVTIKRDAVLGISAHNPKFGREDVVDRMLMLTFTRLPAFITEGSMIERISDNRSRIWGGIVNDLQKVLSTPFPQETEIPQFRITDFARVGLRIARALGVEQSFRDAIIANKKTQTAYTLSEEDILIDALNTWISRRKPKDDEVYWSSSAIWGMLEQFASDHAAFVRGYKNSTQLGKKLWVMNEMLKEVFNIDFQYDTRTGNRRWKITAK